MRALYMLAREARRRSIARVHRPLPPVRRQLRERPGRAPATWAEPTPPRSSSAGSACLTACRPVVETAGFAPLVNGKDLTGWEGDTQLWSVRDGVLVGHSPGLDHNEFLATTRSYGDFVLSLNFRMVDGKGNSGVQFRSVRVPRTTRCRAIRPTSAKDTGARSTTSRAATRSWCRPRKMLSRR